jgi:hypothetical protein
MSAEKEPEQEVIVIQEEKDGSATIELPKSIPSPEAQPEDDTDEADDRARQKEMVVGGVVDDDAEALREQKRLKRHRRKEYHKQVSTEKDVKLSHLERQNQQLLERLSVLERKSHGSDLARLDKAIEDQDNRILFAKKKISEATSTGNGELLTSAQEMWFEARRQAEALANLKKRAVAPQNQRTIQAPDPQLQRHANNWMANNPWYDASGKDPDSRRALNEDSILAEEGYDPKTAEYWEELDRRLQRVVPHRYTEDAEERPRSKPRSAVTSSGREFASNNGKGNSFTLSPEQVRAMKDAGMWDDNEKRARMIKRYALEARNNNG